MCKTYIYSSFSALCRYNSKYKLSSRIIQGLANIITGLKLTLQYRTLTNPSIRVTYI